MRPTLSGAVHETAGAGAATADAAGTVPAAASDNPESAGPAHFEESELNGEADMIRFIDAFWAHLNDMRRPAPRADLYRLKPGTADCLRYQCRIEHARLVVLDAQRGAAWLGRERKKIRV